MKPVFFSFKSINISWFMALSIISIIISYLLLKLIYKDDKEKKEKFENIFFIVVFSGFISARLFYVLLNFNSFKNNLTAIFSISHYNLSLVGGVIGGLVSIYFSSKNYKLDLKELLNIFTILFFLSMAIGVWNFLFDIFLLTSYNLGGANIRVMILSFLFLVVVNLQIILGKSSESKYQSIVLLVLSLIVYYIIKLGLVF